MSPWTVASQARGMKLMEMVLRHIVLTTCRFVEKPARMRMRVRPILEAIERTSGWMPVVRYPALGTLFQRIPIHKTPIRGGSCRIRQMIPPTMEQSATATKGSKT